MTNRKYIDSPEKYPVAQTFAAGMEFLKANMDSDNWFLQIESFDPHEPFDAPPEYREDYPTEYRGPILDYHNHGPAKELPEETAELRANYAATLAHCDYQLGRLLDWMDDHGMWEDTAVVMSTDHGLLLSEHGMWGKVVMPVYNEIAHIPLMIYHPAHRDKGGERRSGLTQTIDLMPTFLDMFGASCPPEVQGKSLLPLINDPSCMVRDVGVYGTHGCAINATDGRYTYFLYPRDMHGANLFNYTLMPTHIKSRFAVEELKDLELSEPFSFSKGIKLLKIPCTEKSPIYNRQGPGRQIDCETKLFDLLTDPNQLTAIDNPQVESYLRGKIVEVMRALDAPDETYDRFGLPRAGTIQH